MDIEEDSFTSKIEKIKKSYFEERIFESYELLIKFQKEYEDKINQSSSQSEINAFTKWKNSEIYSDIINDYKVSKESLESFDTFTIDNTWTKSRDINNKRIYYKTEEGKTTITVTAEALIPARMFNVLALIIENELYPLWVPRINRCTTLHSFGRFKRTIYARIAVQFPFKDREAYCYGFGTLIPNRKAILVCLWDVDRFGSKLNEKDIIRDSKCVRMNIIKGSFLFEYIDENHCIFRALFNVDPHMFLIPQWLINFATKKVIYMFLGILINEAKKLRLKELLQKMEENKNIYEYVENEMLKLKNLF